MHFILKRIPLIVQTKYWKPSYRHISNNGLFSLNERFKVHIISALSDNFMYLLTDKNVKYAVAIDPVEPDKIYKILEHEKLSLKAVLTTHHHLDHSGGNKIIAERNTVPIYGGDDRIDAMTIKLSHEQIFNIGQFTIKCLHTPCHTSGHVSYFVKANSLTPICFTGDTLFVGGCGRFFEGTSSHMLTSLNLLSSLPLNTIIFCGHEYTLNNLRFALAVEPDNKCVIEKLQIVEEKLKRGEPSVPSTIEEELTYNPFLRTNQKNVQLCTNQTDPVLVMKVLREMKDNFR